MQGKTRSALPPGAAVERGRRLRLVRFLLGAVLALGAWALLIFLGGPARADSSQDPQPSSESADPSPGATGPILASTQASSRAVPRAGLPELTAAPVPGFAADGSSSRAAATDAATDKAQETSSADTDTSAQGATTGGPRGPRAGEGGANGVADAVAAVTSRSAAGGRLEEILLQVGPGANVADLPTVVEVAAAPGEAADQAAAEPEALPEPVPPSPPTVTPPSGPVVGQPAPGGDQRRSGPADSRLLARSAPARTITGPVPQDSALGPAPAVTGPAPVDPVQPCSPLAPLSGSAALCPTGTTASPRESSDGSSSPTMPLVAVLSRSGEFASGVATSSPDPAGAGSPASPNEQPGVTPD